MLKDTGAHVVTTRSLRTWLSIFAVLVYIALSWIIFTFTVEHLYGFKEMPTIAADSGAYFDLAGLGDPTEGGAVDSGSLLNLGGSSIGPVLVALIGRTQFGVAVLNCMIFAMFLYWASKVPGARWEICALLLALNTQTLPTLLTLNKEILAIAGLAAFALYVYRRDEPRGKTACTRLLLVSALVFSFLGRWQQLAIPLWYLAVTNKRSPLRKRPRLTVLALLITCSVAYAAAVNLFHVNLSGFIEQAEGGGTIVKVNSIQEKGGYILVAPIKILMNIAGRFVSPGFFLDQYWTTDYDGSLQNQFIGFQSNLVMLGFIFYGLLKNKLRLTRPLVHLAISYFICTAVNPFVQPRYMYPGFALLAIEFSRRGESLELVRPLPAPPRLPRSYLASPMGKDAYHRPRA